MKTLKKLHLKPEQELSDAELKLIKAGGGNDDVYYDCPYQPPGDNAFSVCYYGSRCIIKLYTGPTYTIGVGRCMPDIEIETLSCKCIYM